MAPADVLRILQARQQAWDRHDVSSLAADHGDTGYIESPLFARVQGRADIEKSYRNLFGWFPDWSLVLDAPIVDGNRAAQYFRAKATHGGEFMGLDATGRRVEIQGIAIYRFEDGHIAEERRVYDFTGLLLQVGVLRARPT